ncbi:hypothetical protein AB0F15_00240 [Amycolatopsis sp. NPDC026612]|uniref:hypothetical protein n=1 Tax=Amycolatopsis sp. NPDC026612 TaxID=3155466 RepID=UPI0033D54795
MRAPTLKLTALARLQDEVDAQARKVFNPDGTRNRQVLLELSDLASEIVRICEEGSAEMCRLANAAYDLAMTK